MEGFMAATLGPFTSQVFAFVRRPDGKYLLVRRTAKQTPKIACWELPGGPVQPGEATDVALTREVKLRTGLTVTVEAPFELRGAAKAGDRVVRLFMECSTRDQAGAAALSRRGFKWLTLEDLAEEWDKKKREKRLVEDVREAVKAFCGSLGYGAKPRTKDGSIKPKWLGKQTALFERAQPDLEELTGILEKYLEGPVHEICPLAPTVKGRVKGIPSFVEKILRKNKYVDPLHEMTDLCGVRVVVQTKDEVDRVCRFIREHFKIDERNSLDTLDRLATKEFGYRSVHFIVQLDKKRFPKTSEKLRMLKAEVQVRTMLQHAWADIGHDRLYKGGFPTPPLWERESARLAALLESGDNGFGRLVSGLEAYRSNFGAYLKPDEIKREIEVVQTVLQHKPGDPALCHRLARLAMSLDDWKQAIAFVSGFRKKHPNRLTADLLCCLGASLCHKNAENRNRPGFLQGRRELRKALKLDRRNVEARVCLAESARGNKERLRWYAEAFEISPGDPDVLDGYIRSRILNEQSADFLPLLRPDLEAAIERCRLQVSVGMNLPRALYRIAGFELLLHLKEQPEREVDRRPLSARARRRAERDRKFEWDWLATYARAVHVTNSPSPLGSAFESVRVLAAVEKEHPYVAWTLRFLLLARRALALKLAKEAAKDGSKSVARVPLDKALKDLRTRGEPSLTEPVTIIAGACDPARVKEMAGYRELLRNSFADFRGTLISGGTQQGICGLVAEIGSASRGRLRTVGYLPRKLPRDGTATIDRRYDRRPRTDGNKGFSAFEPLQNWIDLMVSGIDPAQVHVIGINGGRIAALEYRLAWALGAQVAVLHRSGRSADEIEAGVRNGEFTGILVVPKDTATLRAFLLGGNTKFGDDALVQMARLAHAKFLEEGRHKNKDRSMQPWESLGEDFRQSNRDQAAYMEQTLNAGGFDVKRATGPFPVLDLTEARFDDAVETMAQLEHGRWNVERTRSGWRYGEKRDPDQMISPYLVPWVDLAEDIREYDRVSVRRFPLMLARLGWQVVPRK
jgi:ppGpp synthetase/RelA/SpoT-type nucleotidyltranferase/ADP-ribose pyrophosphatase YjhB (NUDIX family)